MKAIVVSEVGGPEKLEFRDISDPHPGPGQVLVAVEAAGLNFIDTYHRSGLYKLPIPFVPGSEGSGTVVAIGEGVQEYQSDDRVGWPNTLGSYAGLIAVDEDSLVRVPEGLTTSDAAAVLLQGLTAHYLATSTYPLGTESTCLIHAGAGGVGLLLTQIAKHLGARVITTVGTSEKAETSRDAGADHVVVYTEEDFSKAVNSLLGDKSVDVVYDGVGAATFIGSLDVLRPRGTMVTFGNASGPVPDISPLLLSAKGSIFLTRPTLAHYIASREELAARCNELFGWVSEQLIMINIGATFALSDAAEAHRALEGRKTTGKVLLIP